MVQVNALPLDRRDMLSDFASLAQSANDLTISSSATTSHDIGKRDVLSDLENLLSLLPSQAQMNGATSLVPTTAAQDPDVIAATQASKNADTTVTQNINPDNQDNGYAASGPAIASVPAIRPNIVYSGSLGGLPILPLSGSVLVEPTPLRDLTPYITTNAIANALLGNDIVSEVPISVAIPFKLGSAQLPTPNAGSSTQATSGSGKNVASVPQAATGGNVAQVAATPVVVNSGVTAPSNGVNAAANPVPAVAAATIAQPSSGIAVIPVKAGDVTGIAIIPVSPPSAQVSSPVVASPVPAATPPMAAADDVPTPVQPSASVETAPTPNDFDNGTDQTVNKTPVGSGTLAPGEASAINATAINPIGRRSMNPYDHFTTTRWA